MEQQSVAMDVIKHLIRLVMVVCVTALVSIAVVVVSFVAFLNQYEYSSSTDVQIDSGQGCAIFQDGKGNTINGNDQSEENQSND